LKKIDDHNFFAPYFDVKELFIYICHECKKGQNGKYIIFKAEFEVRNKKNYFTYIHDLMKFCLSSFEVKLHLGDVC
jgi:hypothetical protein